MAKVLRISKSTVLFAFSLGALLSTPLISVAAQSINPVNTQTMEKTAVPAKPMTTEKPPVAAQVSAPLKTPAPEKAQAPAKASAPAPVDSVTLTCQNDVGAKSNWGRSFNLKVDFEQNTVSLLATDGTLWLTSESKITEGEVLWNRIKTKSITGSEKFVEFAGKLDRLSGQGSVHLLDKSGTEFNFGGACRRLTKRF